MTLNDGLLLGLAAFMGYAIYKRYTAKPAPKPAEPPKEQKANGPEEPTKKKSVWDNVQAVRRWPVDPANIKRVGQSVMADRNGEGRPHKGIDIFADAGTEVKAAQRGTVRQVTDGRTSKSETRKAAGLWVDIEGAEPGSLIYRYLHLGEARVKEGDKVEAGQVLGTIAPPFMSGLADAPHLHFEIRSQDNRDATGYGTPIDPLTRLPSLQNVA